VPLNCKLYADGFAQDTLLNSTNSILESTELCSIATSDGKSPYIHTAYFAYSSDLMIYFLSPPSAQHSINISVNPLVSISVFSGSQPYGGDLKGLQIFGECILSSGALSEKAFAIYAERFPKIYNRLPSFADYQNGVIESRLYQIQAQTIKIFDEPRFGKRIWIVASALNQVKN
jgi:uncharacterized protein